MKDHPCDKIVSRRHTVVFVMVYMLSFGVVLCVWCGGSMNHVMWWCGVCDVFVCVSQTVKTVMC